MQILRNFCFFCLGESRQHTLKKCMNINVNFGQFLRILWFFWMSTIYLIQIYCLSKFLAKGRGGTFDLFNFCTFFWHIWIFLSVMKVLLDQHQMCFLDPFKLSIWIKKNIGSNKILTPCPKFPFKNRFRTQNRQYRKFRLTIAYGELQ